MTIVTTKDVAKALSRFYPSFRNRTYRDGSKVVFMTIKNATYGSVNPSSMFFKSDEPLSINVIWQVVEQEVPGARCTSGGLGNATFRLPDYVKHITNSIPHKLPDQAYRKLYKWHITIQRQYGNFDLHEEKGRGSQNPTVSLRSAFAALGQLIKLGDNNFVLAVKNRGTGKAVIQTPLIGIVPQL